MGSVLWFCVYTAALMVGGFTMGVRWTCRDNSGRHSLHLVTAAGALTVTEVIDAVTGRDPDSGFELASAAVDHDRTRRIPAYPATGRRLRASLHESRIGLESAVLARAAPVSSGGRHRLIEREAS